MTATSQKSYDRVAKVFDFLRAGDMKRWSRAQKDLFRPMQGRVVYIGMGTGLEIDNFPRGLDITAIDLSPKMLELGRRRAAAYPGALRMGLMDAQKLAFRDQTFDTAVAVCVFCTVAHPVQGLRELRRVLKPGGQLLMFEHVLSRNPVYGSILRLMSNVTEALEGTYLTRKTTDNIRKAGFRIESEQNVYLDIVKAIRAVPD